MRILFIPLIQPDRYILHSTNPYSSSLSSCLSGQYINQVCPSLIVCWMDFLLHLLYQQIYQCPPPLLYHPREAKDPLETTTSFNPSSPLLLLDLNLSHLAQMWIMCYVHPLNTTDLFIKYWNQTPHLLYSRLDNLKRWLQWIGQRIHPMLVYLVQ